MSRAERLLGLMEVLRRHRRPVSGRDLAATLGVSLRTLYRDIASLQAQGAQIEGAAGLGYVLRPGFTLPPLMFTPDEIEALALGSHFVASRGDDALAAAARQALAKIGAVLPAGLREAIEGPALLVGPGAAGDAAHEPAIRAAMRGERKLALHYRDAGGIESERVVWPVALGFFEGARVMAAWCELRGDFRHFRTDRILGLETGGRYPQRRLALLREWRRQQAFDADEN